MNTKNSKQLTTTENKPVKNYADRIKDLEELYTTQSNFILDHTLLKERDELNQTKDKTPEQKKRGEEVTRELSMIYGLENGLWASNLSYGKYYSMLGNIRRSITQEYDCKTASELMLADRIVASYWRLMKYDMTLNRLIETDDGGYSFNQSKVNIIKELQRGIELADRQLNSNIILLKDLRQPRLNVKIKTETAYIAQNQQVVNKEQESTVKEVEIIKDK